MPADSSNEANKTIVLINENQQFKNVQNFQRLFSFTTSKILDYSLLILHYSPYLCRPN